MRKFMMLLFLTFSLSLTAQNEKIIGSWSGESKGESGTIIFDADGFITFIIDGSPMGGKEFDIEGQKGSMSYVVDYSVSPYPVEISIKIQDIDAGKIYGYIDILDEDTMKMATGTMNQKITGITEENSIVLTRDKE